MITTGQVGAGTTFIHDMANELITARRCYDEHTRLIRLMKGLHEKNHNWKGKKATYRTIHTWVVSNKGTATQCESCSKKGIGRQIHWANINHEYNRNLDEYVQLCAKCHGEFDKKNNLRKKRIYN